jgi:hypothetical protein
MPTIEAQQKGLPRRSGCRVGDGGFPAAIADTSVHARLLSMQDHQTPCPAPRSSASRLGRHEGQRRLRLRVYDRITSPGMLLRSQRRAFNRYTGRRARTSVNSHAVPAVAAAWERMRPGRLLMLPKFVYHMSKISGGRVTGFVLVGPVAQLSPLWGSHGL